MSLYSNNLASLPGSLPSAVSDVWNGRCKSWANFNGQGGIGVRRGFRIASVSDLGTGRYRVNWGGNLSNAYDIVASCGHNRTSRVPAVPQAEDHVLVTGQKNTSSFYLFEMDIDSGITNSDPVYVSYAMFTNDIN